MFPLPWLEDPVLKEWLENHADLVRWCVNDHRNYTGQQFRKAVEGFHAENGYWPKLDVFLDIVLRRLSPTPPVAPAGLDMEADEATLKKQDLAAKKKYQKDLEEWERKMKVAVWWHDKFLPACSGGHLLSQQTKTTRTISEAGAYGLTAIPPNTEAYGMLLLENGEQRHINIVANLQPGSTKKKAAISRKQDHQKEDKTKNMQGKWTTQFAGKAPYGSWSREGLKRFKELVGLVSAARQDPNCAPLEAEILARVRLYHGLPRDVNAKAAPVPVKAPPPPVPMEDVWFEE